MHSLLSSLALLICFVSFLKIELKAGLLERGKLFVLQASKEQEEEEGVHIGGAGAAEYYHKVKVIRHDF